MKTAKNTSQKLGALKKPQNKTCCQVVALKDRSLLSPIQAGGLAAVFKVLANDTRLRLLHALVRDEELCVRSLLDQGLCLMEEVSSRDRARLPR
jgi:hypothetical protein